jgi:hypothetical protein
MAGTFCPSGRRILYGQTINGWDFLSVRQPSAVVQQPEDHRYMCLLSIASNDVAARHIHAYMHTYMHTCIHTCIHTCMHAFDLIVYHHVAPSRLGLRLRNPNPNPNLQNIFEINMQSLSACCANTHRQRCKSSDSCHRVITTPWDMLA